MKRKPSFTKAQIVRAIKGAQSAGLQVSSVTIHLDGSITISSGEEKPTLPSPKKDLAGWDDV